MPVGILLFAAPMPGSEQADDRVVGESGRLRREPGGPGPTKDATRLNDSHRLDRVGATLTRIKPAARDLRHSGRAAAHRLYRRYAMHTSLQITFRNLDRSFAVEQKIRERAAKLERHFGNIMSCRVAVELLHKQHRQGNHFQVRIDLTVPGGELVSSREPDDRHAYTDVYVAIRDAFDAMDRMLEEYVERMRRQMKAHDTPLHG